MAQRFLFITAWKLITVFPPQRKIQSPKKKKIHKLKIFQKNLQTSLNLLVTWDGLKLILLINIGKLAQGSKMLRGCHQKASKALLKSPIHLPFSVGFQPPHQQMNMTLAKLTDLSKPSVVQGAIGRSELFEHFFATRFDAMGYERRRTSTRCLNRRWLDKTRWWSDEKKTVKPLNAQWSKKYSWINTYRFNQNKPSGS